MAEETNAFPFRHHRDSNGLAPFMNSVNAMPELTLDDANTMPDPFSFASPTAWNDYQRLVNDELARNDEREFGIKQEVDQSVFEEYTTSTNSTGTKIVKWEDDIEDERDPPNHRGYMSKTSPFSLDFLTPDMSFLEWYPKGPATITYLNELGDVESIGNLSAWVIEQRSLLLSEAFEHSPSGPRLHLEAVTPTTIRPLLQFLYTGAYILPTSSGEPFEDVPTSLLTHCQLYRLGDIYDLQELKSAANVGVIRQCEFGCSSPDKPIDLCSAIEYVYKNMREHTGLIDTIVNYCVTCFLTHGLGDDFEFRRMAFDLRPFHQEMCKVSMSREFEDQGTAQAIIQMPFKPYVPDTYASREDWCGSRTAQFDDIYHFHGDDLFENSPKKRKRPEMAQGPRVSGITLALRQKSGEDAKDEMDNDDEELYGGLKKRATSEQEPKINKEADSDKDAVFWEAASTAGSGGSSPSRESPASRRNSDSDYDIVSGPASVEVLSSDDSESEATTLVVVNWSSEEEAEEASELPIRTRTSVSSITAVERRDSSASDSDWDLI